MHADRSRAARVDGAGDESRGALAHALGQLDARCSPMRQNESATSGTRQAADLPLIQHLHGGLAAPGAPTPSAGRSPLTRWSSLATASSRASERRHLDGRPSRPPTPCSSAPGCARSSASSAEFVVSTPNAIGHAGGRRGVREAVRDGLRDVLEVRRRAADEAPEADRPPSNRPVSAARCAASGISKLPGTRTTITSLDCDLGRRQRLEGAGDAAAR